MEPVLHPTTSAAVEDFLKKPSHSLLLSAPIGSGKLYLANYLAKQLLNKQSLLNEAFYYHIYPADNVITINTIRELKSFLHLKTTGSNSVRRVVVIEQAEAMNQEAQNATLKLIEEPPKDTAIILTSTSPQSLLPTIRSRLQTITIHKPSQEAVLRHFESEAGTEELQKSYRMSDGRIGLMQALLEDTEEPHPLASSINLAKKLYGQSAYERLVAVNNLSSEDLEMLCRGLYGVAHAALIVASEKGNAAHVAKWYRTCKLIHNTQDELRFKPQTKLLLTHLLINL